MIKTTRSTCITISSLLVGILIGCTAVSYLLVTNAPTPLAPIALSASASITPACIAVLAISLLWKPLRRFTAPVLALAGMAVPFDFAFACLLGVFDDVVLRGIVGLLFLCAAALMAWVMGSIPRRIAYPTALANHAKGGSSPLQPSGAVQ